ncbi:MAG TPA: lysine--tRNA ligase [Candidatus Saccharimonadales bacterium]
MKWLDKIVEELSSRTPDGEIVVSSGVTPSGKYHLGTLREILTAEAIARELTRRGREAKHLHVVDDFDVFRKVPKDVPAEWSAHLGKPVFLVPAPDGSQQSYADYFLQDLEKVSAAMRLNMEIVRAHQKYAEGFYSQAIEQSVDRQDDIRRILTDISGHKLDENWSPLQVLEDGYIKTRQVSGIDKEAKKLRFVTNDGKEEEADYAHGQAKLNWRIDWPARWWRLGVTVEPFGRDHATKGGSYDTGAEIARQIFNYEPPLPVPYHFINRVGETKKLSKSDGNVVTAAGLLDFMPIEVVWYFMLRYAPSKQLFFDEGASLARLFDDFAALIHKADKTESESHLLELCLMGVEEQTISSVPFSHLVASYQAAFKDTAKTLEIIGRTEYQTEATQQADIIRRELKFIDKWLEQYAPKEVRFSVQEVLPEAELSPAQASLLDGLSEAIEKMESNQDGQWFHERIYEQKDALNLSSSEAFQAVYRVILNQDKGPQAGWFLAALDKDWLVKRLRRQA